MSLPHTVIFAGVDKHEQVPTLKMDNCLQNSLSYFVSYFVSFEEQPIGPRTEIVRNREADLQ